MQEKSLELHSCKIGCSPIIDRFIERLSLRTKLSVAMSNDGYAEAIIILLKNILIDRDALYAIREWAKAYSLLLSSGREIGDDRLGRALDRLFDVDRATLQTEIVLSMIKTFRLKMDQIHSDTTSVTVSGSYAGQNCDAVQLKRGHSKDHRPDLKQLIYNLCVSRDGAVPVHFKCYDGNRSDDSIQWETWNSLRVLLQKPDFVYVGDSKLCVEDTMRRIDRERGQFITMVPRTRKEVDAFAQSLLEGDVRWERCLRRRSTRHSSDFDTFDVAVGHFQLREGFRVNWYRSSQKQRRDAEDRKARINRAQEKLENLNLKRLRGPKTESAMRKRVDAVLARLKVEDWLRVDIKMDTTEEFKAISRGRATTETRYRKLIKKTPRLHIQRVEEEIANSQLMDGIFPLATNTKQTAVEVLKAYKYQPKLEKRHALLKSTLDVAPVWLKKNERIEALMFVEYLAQTVAALIERDLRNAMAKANINLLQSLPEGRASKTPTFEQLLRLFENRDRHELFEKDRPVKLFAQPLSKVQEEVLTLLDVPTSAYTA